MKDPRHVVDIWTIEGPKDGYVIILSVHGVVGDDGAKPQHVVARRVVKKEEVKKALREREIESETR